MYSIDLTFLSLNYRTLTIDDDDDDDDTVQEDDVVTPVDVVDVTTTSRGELDIKIAPNEGVLIAIHKGDADIKTAPNEGVLIAIHRDDADIKTAPNEGVLIAIHRDDAIKTEVCCCNCGKNFSRKDSLARHLSNKQCKDKGHFAIECARCGKVLSSVSNRRKHEKQCRYAYKQS